MWWIILAVVLVVVVAVGYPMVRDRWEARRIIKLSLGKHRIAKGRKLPKGAQTCSYCRKKGKLVFYAEPSGRVVGVCPVCRPQAERRALTRL